MNNLDGILRLRMPQTMIDHLAREANEQMLTLSAYVRLVLARHLGLIEPPSVLVDPAVEYRVPVSQTEAMAELEADNA